MIQFELDVDKSTIRVKGDSTNVCSEFPVYMDVTQWCINYLKQYMYRSVNQIVTARKQACLHVKYLDKIGDCDNLLLRNDLLQSSDDWVAKYLELLRYGFLEIAPSSSSRYFEGFYKKRNELIEMLKHYSSNVPMYSKVNVATQQRLKF
jgi:hypothetical protein